LEIPLLFDMVLQDAGTVVLTRNLKRSGYAVRPSGWHPAIHNFRFDHCCKRL